MSSSLYAAFFTQVGIVTYREYAGSGVSGGGIITPTQAPIGLPLPSVYTAPIIVYGALALFPSSAGNLPGLIGWGFVVATLLNLWNPSGKVNAPASVQGTAANAQTTTSSGNPLPATRVSST